MAKRHKTKSYNVELAKEIVAAAQRDEALYVNITEAQQLEPLTNPQMNNQPCFIVDYDDRNSEDHNQVLVEATLEGINFFTPQPQLQPQVSAMEITPVTNAMGFQIVEGYDHPKRSADHLIKREAQYPWDDPQLTIGRSFFVPSSINPSTGKLTSVASAVAAQNRKRHESTQDCTFTVRRGTFQASPDAAPVEGEWVKKEAYRIPRKRRTKQEEVPVQMAAE